MTLMKRSLTKEHRLAGHIKENPPQFNASTNRVEVSFNVQVGPVTNVRTVGARLTVIPFLAGREMRKLIPIYSEGTIDRDLVEEGERNLTDYFQKKAITTRKSRPNSRSSRTRSALCIKSIAAGSTK